MNMFDEDGEFAHNEPALIDEKPKAKKARKPKAKKPEKPKALFNFWGIWHDEYRRVYHIEPIKLGQFLALLKSIALQSNEIEFRACVRQYLTNPTPSYLNNGHPIGSLVYTWNRWKAETANAVAQAKADAAAPEPYSEPEEPDFAAIDAALSEVPT